MKTTTFTVGVLATVSAVTSTPLLGNVVNNLLGTVGGVVTGVLNGILGTVTTSDTSISTSTLLSSIIGGSIEVNLGLPNTFINLPALTIIRLGADVGNNKVPFTYSSTIDVRAVGSEVVNNNARTPGPSNAVGLFKFGLNSRLNTICYNITLFNVNSPYRTNQHATATHIHEGARGKDGLVRIVFPNPTGPGTTKNSIGCLTGSFKTGTKDSKGVDLGQNFKISQIEANPKGFFADVHTIANPHGFTRAQLQY